MHKIAKFFYTGKFNTLMYVSWPQVIEKLHIIDKVVAQHQIHDQTKVRGQICDS